MDKLEKNGADFVGMTENHDKNVPSHIQSWFLGLSKPVFSGALFDDFISGVSHQKNKWDIVMKYEVGLSQALLRAGYKMHAIMYNNFKKHILYDEPIHALNLGIPFVKKLALANIDELHYLYPHMCDDTLWGAICGNAIRTNNNKNVVLGRYYKYKKIFRFSFLGLPIITIYSKKKYPEHKVCLFEYIPIIKISY